jgi:hypothetical protein
MRKKRLWVLEDQKGSSIEVEPTQEQNSENLNPDLLLKNLVDFEDPFAELEENIVLLPEELRFQNCPNKKEWEEFLELFFIFLSVSSVGTNLTLTCSLASLCLTAEDLERMLERVPSPFIHRLAKRFSWIIPGPIVINTFLRAFSITKPILGTIDNLDHGKEKNKNIFSSFPKFIENDFVAGISEEQKLEDPMRLVKRYLPVRQNKNDESGQIINRVSQLTVVINEIRELEEMLEDPNLSEEERKRILRRLRMLYLLFPFLLPYWILEKGYRTPYPYIGGILLILLYLAYRNREFLLVLLSKCSKTGYQTYLKIFKKELLSDTNKQVALMPGKQVAVVLSNSEKQLIKVLTNAEKQIAIILNILDKQVALVTDKNKQLALVLDILSKQLELIPDKNKQVAIVLDALAKQLVLRSNPTDNGLLTGIDVATSMDVVVFNQKKLILPLLVLLEYLNRSVNYFPLNGEDHF